ncbi:hypothetical protein [Bifidobacterium longum]|uniref:hypothetical protein n=1 Tax=Bifidobacterium longum TaxID=216816 RepID=UPI00387828DE
MYWRFGLRITEVSGCAVAFVIVFLLTRLNEPANNIVAIAVSSIGTFFNVQGFKKKKQIKLHCAWRNFRYLVFPPEKGFIATICTNRTHRRNSSQSMAAASISAI